MRHLFLAAALLVPLGQPVLAQDVLTLAPRPVTDWKAVYGRVEARDRIPARARIGGTVVELAVSEGDMVAAGDRLGRIVDEKIAFQLTAIDAQKTALEAQLANAETELKRGEDLLAQGVTTAQRLDALRTQVDVLNGQMQALDAQRQVVAQQAAEGDVLAPVSGRVLDVPVARGAVIMPGEPVAAIGGGGIFLRLAVPERYAARLKQGDAIQIEGPEGPQDGRLVRIYPLIENGRVVADVEVEGLPDNFVDARMLVRLPLGAHDALEVPQTAIMTRNGLDFVTVETEAGPVARLVVPGAARDADGGAMVEILSGLRAGDRVLTVAPTATAAEGATNE